MLRGIDLLADAVSVTFGPCGRTVLIEGSGASGPRVVRAGATVADALDPPGRFERIGLRLLRRAAQRVGEDLGDGTTTVVVLARAIAAGMLRAVAAGIDATALQRAVAAGVDTAVADLRARAMPATGRKDLARIAAVAAGGDAALGDTIADAFEAVGDDGLVSIEAGRSVETALLRRNGIRWEGGYVSPYFMTDPVTTECSYEAPLVLLTERKLEFHEPLLKALETAVRARSPLFIVADAITGEALQTLVTNKVRNNLRVVAGRSPLFGDRRREILEDVAAVTGARLVPATDALGRPGELGRADRVVLTRDATEIVGGKGEAAAVEARIAEIRAEQAQGGGTPYRGKFLRGRLASLAGGAALVRVGGATASRIAERQARATGAANAVRAARRDGILPGGGAAYMHAGRALPAGRTLEERAARSILVNALADPMTRIVDNAGFDGRSLAMRLPGDARFGFDVRAGSFVDLARAGVVDSAGILTSALQAAVSVAASLANVEVAIAKPLPPARPVRSDEMPFGPEAKDMTAEEARGFGLV